MRLNLVRNRGLSAEGEIASRRSSASKALACSRFGSRSLRTISCDWHPMRLPLAWRVLIFWMTWPSPLPHAQLHPVAPEVEIVSVEIEGFVGGRPESSLAHPLGLAALFDGELDLGLARDKNAPEAVVWFGPHH